MKTLLTIGHGYTAAALTRRLLPQGWRVIGTTRGHPENLISAGIEPVLWPGTPLASALAEATHVLSSVPPGPEGDPVLAAEAKALAEAGPHLEWVGYLSTTGVYGDHGGGWVDETTPLTPGTSRGRARADAEAAWFKLAMRPGLPLHVFRLAGIYGPGRAPFEAIRNGSARRIIKPGQMFSRIHVDDIATVLAASIAQPDPGAVYNVCDDLPSPPEDVITYAAKLLGLPPPPAVPFAEAELGPMARSFYAESKQVRNDWVKTALGVQLAYPTYREGLAAVLKAESSR
ncbi:SDR family oxidoreductase [Phaeovulum sp.]|uniref:SDR family oxidoreductase n=1 Tax=Phaeovulum sp. TaxID=2934796 RepID=UPI0035617766